MVDAICHAIGSDCRMPELYEIRCSNVSRAGRGRLRFIDTMLDLRIR